MTTVAEACASKVLDPEVHARLIANIEQFARDANVPKHLVWTPLSDHCGEPEVEYLRKLPQHADHNTYGLLFHGRKPSSPVHMRMMAMAGACLRNFLSAKVMTVQEVLDCLRKGQTIDVSVLFVSNFFIGKEQGGNIPSWQVSALLGLLLERQSARQQTILYVEDVKDMAAQYGDHFAEHFKNYFERISA